MATSSSKNPEEGFSLREAGIRGRAPPDCAARTAPPAPATEPVSYDAAESCLALSFAVTATLRGLAASLTGIVSVSTPEL